MMLRKLNAVNPGFVDTYEAYSKKIFIGSNNVVIPYVNIGLMPSNPINHKQSVVDFSYYVFIDVGSMNFSAKKGKLTVNFNENIDVNGTTEYIMAGGYESGNSAEIKIVCKDILFFLLDEARINDTFHPYLPLDTPNFKQNIDTKEVDDFFSLKNLPTEIREILGENLYSLIWW